MVVASFPCPLVQFPIKYLVPLSVGKIPKMVLQPLVDMVADKLPPGEGNS
jgi:hypothetical protein